MTGFKGLSVRCTKQNGDRERKERNSENICGGDWVQGVCVRGAKKENRQGAETRGTGRSEAESALKGSAFGAQQNTGRKGKGEELRESKQWQGLGGPLSWR